MNAEAEFYFLINGSMLVELFVWNAMSTSNHATPEIIILPALNCRRSQKVLDYLTSHDISITRVPLESPEGQAIAERYHLRSSPGIIVDGEMINPFDILIQPACRIDEAEFYRRFHLERTTAIS